MEYFVDANIMFKGNVDLKMIDDAIKKATKEEDTYSLEVPKENMVKVILTSDFNFWNVEKLVKAVLSTGLKKFGRDKLIAYQTTADCYFKNYVTKDGQFLDFCGDCIY